MMNYDHNDPSSALAVEPLCVIKSIVVHLWPSTSDFYTLRLQQEGRTSLYPHVNYTVDK